MQPSRHITKELERFHKWLRIGWWVPNDGNPDGVYSLIQLYHTSDAERAALVQPWNKRGPVYGTPYDTFRRVPMWIRDIDPAMLKNDGAGLLELVREWARPIRERYTESSTEAWKTLDSELADHAEGMGDYIWSQSKRTGASPGITAKKFLDPEKKKIMSGDYDPETARNIVETPTPKNAVAMK